MNLHIHEQLDPVFETMGLLYVSYQPAYRKIMIEDLEQFGLDGEAFYNKHLKIMDKYISSFTKHRKTDDNSVFFFNEDTTDFFLLLQVLLSENPEWLTSLKATAETAVQDKILKTINEMPAMQSHSPRESALSSIQSLPEVISFLNGSPLGESTKWKLMTLLHQPREHLHTLIEIVKMNLPAFEKALREVEKQVSKLIPAYVQSIKRQQDEQFITFLEMSDDENPAVYPALILPLGQMVLSGNHYYGLYLDMLPIASKQHSDSRELLLLRMKALADSSKLQILASLKISPKYNLEIADQLGLTAATMSHHMNVLLACGMVRVEKNNGRVYYHLHTENLHELIADLQQFLL
ncbi:metalloregulator ArsR/SmtB family transcription factor [Paenibacillus sp. FSL R7-0345]|uniref:ArsR/SmtB family transcription factor n=1 Tax=Paenibacillus sp. FSL R7-0345 TaxID=2954535 RepID=UPI00315B01FD